MEITKRWLKPKWKTKNVNNNKPISKGYIHQYWQKYNTFANDRITQYMHQIASGYIVVFQQKWNNTYVETSGVNIANFCFQDKELMRIIIFKFF